jgi:voltage-gated potassium channel
MRPYVRRFLILGAGIAVALLAGTAGYVWIGHYPWFDAFYMASITMTTVGYAEVRPLSEAGRAFNTVYLLLSASLLLLTMGMVTQTVVEMQLGNVFGRRRMKKMIEKVRGHYIVCGFGRVGRGAAEELQQAGAEVVVIDRREDRIEWAGKSGCGAMLGDSTRDDTLREAGIERAAGLIAALATDADNLFAVISAKGLNPSVRVAARAAEDEAERKLRQVGADVVFAPYKMTGARMAQSLLRPHVYQFLSFATASGFRIEQLAVAASSDLVGRSLAQLHVRRDLKVIVVAIRRAGGEMEFNPGGDTVVSAGDSLIVMGEEEPLRKLESRVTGVES